MRRTSLVLAVALAAGIGQAASAADTPSLPAVPEASAETAETPTEPVVEQEAVDALKAMGTYLRTLKAFEVTSDYTVEDVLDDGQKIMESGAATYLARMPDRLAVNLDTDTSQRQFFYDGKTLTMFGPGIGYYASVDAPATISEMLGMAAERYGIEVPLADLFLWGTEGDGTADLTSAFLVGSSRVGDRFCDHYAFRQQGADWQLWIEADDTPLPCRVVITATDDEYLPQYISDIAWTLDAPVPDSAFIFTPPEDAKKIPLEEISADGGN